MAGYLIRDARIEDCDDIFRLIVELAEYEKLVDRITINADVLRKDGFGEEKLFRCIVAEPVSDDASQESKLIGYILYFSFYSTFNGRACHMEDFYVTPQWRGKGVGTALWVQLTTNILNEGCSHLQLDVLDWNKPSIEYYKSCGMFNVTEKDGWQRFRMSNTVMKEFVAKKSRKGVNNSL